MTKPSSLQNAANQLYCSYLHDYTKGSAHSKARETFEKKNIQKLLLEEATAGSPSTDSIIEPSFASSTVEEKKEKESILFDFLSTAQNIRNFSAQNIRNFSARNIPDRKLDDPKVRREFLGALCLNIPPAELKKEESSLNPLEKSQ